MEQIDRYLNKRTIIVGDVNSGKTAQTLEVLQLFVQKGYAKKIAILDMGTNPVRGIGGKLHPPPKVPLLYLTASISPPRLMGKDPSHIQKLAEENVRAIERLFNTFQQQPREIVFINDATLYLQAGRLERFLGILDTTETQVINAYYGKAFRDFELTKREKKLTEDLMKTCDQVILLP